MLHDFMTSRHWLTSFYNIKKAFELSWDSAPAEMSKGRKSQGSLDRS